MVVELDHQYGFVYPLADMEPQIHPGNTVWVGTGELKPECTVVMESIGPTKDGITVPIRNGNDPKRRLRKDGKKRVVAALVEVTSEYWVVAKWAEIGPPWDLKNAANKLVFRRDKWTAKRVTGIIE